MNKREIIVASKNPVKIEAALKGFQKTFPGLFFSIIPFNAPAVVSAQPLTSDETLKGARLRAQSARSAFPEAHYWVGIEGGVEPLDDDYSAFAWVYVIGEKTTGRAKTGTFLLPPAVTELIKQGKELGEADDIVFKRTNSKQENGAIGLLTHNLIDRSSLYEHAVILALVPFINPNLY